MILKKKNNTRNDLARPVMGIIFLVIGEGELGNSKVSIVGRAKRAYTEVFNRDFA